MDTPDDIEREEGYLKLVDEIADEAIGEFTYERMRSYYVNNKRLAHKAIAILAEATKLLSSSPTAATVLFTTSIELGIKVVLLKPVIFGLVHNNSVADLISDLAVKHNGLDRFKVLLAKVMAEYGNIDFDTFTIEGHEKTLWDEVKAIQEYRNGIVHRGDLVSPETAELAQEVALMILGNYFPSVLKVLGLVLVNGVIENS